MKFYSPCLQMLIKSKKEAASLEFHIFCTYINGQIYGWRTCTCLLLLIAVTGLIAINFVVFRMNNQTGVSGRKIGIAKFRPVLLSENILVPNDAIYVDRAVP